MIKLSTQKVSDYGDITVPKMIYISIEHQGSEQLDLSENNISSIIKEFCQICRKVHSSYFTDKTSDLFLLKTEVKEKNINIVLYFLSKKYYYVAFRKKPDGSDYVRSQVKKLEFDELKKVIRNLEKNKKKYLSADYSLGGVTKTPKYLINNLKKYYDEEAGFEKGLDYVELFEDARIIEECDGDVKKAKSLKRDWTYEYFDTLDLLGMTQHEKYEIPSLKRFLQDRLEGVKLMLETYKFPLSKQNNAEIYKTFVNLPLSFYDKQQQQVSKNDNSKKNQNPNVKNSQLINQITKQWSSFLKEKEYPSFNFNSGIYENKHGEQMKKLYMMFTPGKYTPYVIKKLKPELMINGQKIKFIIETKF